MEVLLGHSCNGYGSGGDDHLPRSSSVHGDPDRIGWQRRDSNGAKDGARHRVTSPPTERRVILTTTDGGQHWVQQRTDSSTTFFDIQFVDKQVGWAVGTQSSIFQTITGGKNWLDKTPPCGSPCIRPPDFLKIRFTDFRNGWIIGERGAFLVTTDAGFNWTEPELPEPYSLYGLTFPEPHTGWAVGDQGTILKISAPGS